MLLAIGPKNPVARAIMITGFLCGTVARPVEVQAEHPASLCTDLQCETERAADAVGMKVNACARLPRRLDEE